MKYLTVWTFQEVLSQALGCLKAPIWGLLTEWDFPICLGVETRGKSAREIQKYGIIEKDSQKVKKWRKTSSTRDRLTDWNANLVRKKKWSLTIEDTGYMPFIWVLDCIQYCFIFLMCSTFFPNEFLRGLVWSIIVSVPCHVTFPLVLSIQILELNLQKTERETFQLLTLKFFSLTLNEVYILFSF